MSIFGMRWKDYIDRLKENWEKIVCMGDYVLIPGDISWAKDIDGCLEDLKFLNSLPGVKILSKGNHDFFWSSINKVTNFAEDHELSSLRFLQNDAYACEACKIDGVTKYLVTAAARGWALPVGKNEQNEEYIRGRSEKVDNLKIFNREKQRLVLSLNDAKEKIKMLMEKNKVSKENIKLVVMMHHPPVDAQGKVTDFIEIMKKYEVNSCYYGHLHENSYKYKVEGNIDGINLKLVSADFLEFIPYPVDVGI